MKCLVCDIKAAPWAWWHPLRTDRIHHTIPTCTQACMRIWKGRRRMVDPNEHELAAMATASDRAGEFIESTGKTDMARWSPQQWQQFIEVICGSYVDSLCEQQVAINTALERARLG